MNTIKDAKEAVAGQTLSPEIVKELDEAARLLREPTDKSRELIVAYCAAYTDFLIGFNGCDERDRPKPADYGLTEELAEVLRRQCRDMQHKQIDGLRPAVSFTETEARQAASDLREIATACCENGWGASEKTLRVLAQKFDTWRISLR